MTRTPPSWPSREKSLRAFARLLGSVQRRTEPRLRRAIAESQTEASRIGPEVSAMVRALGSLAERGGKRLRPALAQIGARAAAYDGEPGLLLDAGVCLELLQAYFLIHDDWMDQDSERRGGPTAHVELSRAFGSEELGAASAILAGDLAVGLALRRFAALAVPRARLPRALSCFAEMQIAAVYGQQLDIIGVTDQPELTYELKTASYTVRGPLRLGAVLAGAKPALLAGIDEFSLPTGVAFQLRDDLIGVFGDPARTGKPRGGDLTAGKRTYLLQEARRLGSSAEKKALDRVVGRRKASPVELERALASLDSSGARASTERRIAELGERAEASLRSKAWSDEGRLLLRGALIALSERDA